MSLVEIAEVKKRAELICVDVVERLRVDLSALRRRNAANHMLRSGGTVKESAGIARNCIRSYFDQIENFVLSRPVATSPGFDGVVVDAISPSTQNLISSIKEGLLETARLAGSEDYVDAIKDEVSNELSLSQDKFRSNLKAHWASRRSGGSVANRAMLVFEVLCLSAILVTIGMWIQNPGGEFEPFLALFGVCLTAVEIYRRYAQRHAS